MEDTIKQEQAEFDARRAQEEEGDLRARRREPATDRTNPEYPSKVQVGDNKDLDTLMEDDDGDIRGDQSLVNPSTLNTGHTNVSAAAVNNNDEGRRHSDAAAHDLGDVVIEAGEDTVIY